MTLADLHRALAQSLEERGAWPARSPWLRAANSALPRHQFAPNLLWAWDGHGYVPIDRDDDADRWAAEVYAGPDDAAVTQVTDGVPSSSLSCPSVVFDMLDCLEPEPGERVLELGTGTGWNAALLSWRAGPDQVTSVEADPSLAAAARTRLEQAGARVKVETGDGTAGWPGGAPYDRVISTFAVDRVPYAWVAGTRPGGRIVTPWGRLGHLALTVATDGRSASGRVRGLATFMPSRGTPTVPAYSCVRGESPPDDERPVAYDMTPLHTDWHLRFALRVALPELVIDTAVDADGVNAWLHDGASSWAALSAVGDGRITAYQGGPRRLACELEGAWARWVAEGSPSLYDFGMTVPADGDSYMWANDPVKGPRWPIRATAGFLSSMDSRQTMM
ncbi:methyltransferase domain-containing protein [Streptomyces albipurpureus]|uniref:Protein-L-isoaspartate O-methyltransferase n=1 Tax=Streptomyces albipurpureus TaxID=2897419 RepID=A0ABT0UGQ7_9ACTN|nr:methyltransferase domain-containing protein [Streptomyces sp. CWNU-1]MCM2387808.1 methyltransferase domain-containing protein [Streptomyces sp. CWNU-1]